MMPERPCPARRNPPRCRALHAPRLLLLALLTPGSAALPAEPSGALRPGVASRYVKCNLDGSDPWQVSTYPRCLGKTASGPVIGLAGVNPVADAAPPLVDYCPIRVTALGDETLKGVACRKFHMCGKDISLVAWFSPADRHVVRAESARPDSHDWTSFELAPIRAEAMDPLAWQSFRKRVLARFVRPSAPRASDGGSAPR